jgi:hypothetical protein
MIVDVVDTESNNFTISHVKFRLEQGHIAQFGGAHRSEIFRMRKHDGPAVADPLVKVNFTLCGHRSKIWCLVINA